MEEQIPPQRRSVFDEKMDYFCNSAVMTILLIIALVIPTVMVAVGAAYLDKCPIERFIPIYLIVAGAFGIVQTLFSAAMRIKNQCLHKTEQNMAPNPISGLISLFLFAWLIAGCVWVYQPFHRVTTQHEGAVNFCHPVVYWLAFTLITISLCMLMLLVMLFICLGFCVTIHHQ